MPLEGSSKCIKYVVFCKLLCKYNIIKNHNIFFNLKCYYEYYFKSYGWHTAIRNWPGFFFVCVCVGGGGWGGRVGVFYIPRH